MGLGMNYSVARHRAAPRRAVRQSSPISVLTADSGQHECRSGHCRVVAWRRMSSANNITQRQV